MESRVRKLNKIALLSALSISFFVVDFYLPKPIPFLKYGLANLFPLILIVRGKYKESIFVMFFKIFFGNFFTGRLLSPVMILSLFGGISAIVIMVLLRMVFFEMLSLIGYSVVGAFAHIAGQLFALKIFMLPGLNVAFFYKIFWVPTMISAIIIGYVAQKLKRSAIFEI